MLKITHHKIIDQLGIADITVQILIILKTAETHRWLTKITGKTLHQEMAIVIRVFLDKIIPETTRIIGTLILEEMEGAEVTNNRIGGVTTTIMATIAIGITTITKIKVEEATTITIITGQEILEEIIIQG